MSKKRSRARALATQALYQWQVSAKDPQEILAFFLEEHQRSKFHKAYFETLFSGVTRDVTLLDEQILTIIDRKVEELDYVERAILRLSTYELINSLDVPYKVVINEGVELAKTFGADQSHKYINAVLDKLVRQLRCLEVEKG